MTKLPRSFYLQPTLVVARSLLGKHIVRVVNNQTLVGRIVETEAYRGALDPASHAYRGKTRRNEVMFGVGGHLYVYFTYGMHYCANVVTGMTGIGEAVLIRGVEPLEGIEVMIQNRFGTRGRRPKSVGERSRGQHPESAAPVQPLIPGFMPRLTNGPAKFCQAFSIAREENGSDLLGDTVYLLKATNLPGSTIGISTRIGITAGQEKRWRFFIKENLWVSR